ncbi:MAG TPA: Hsp20/alpha crystallin family protein [Candidatus Eisenbacteria bacterium]|nr:Hsp20/alpha crystallin family protein [Candidatus Eisenbacteria bacterium]
MALIRWNPWSIDRFFGDDWDFPTLPGLSHLAGQGLNLYETEDEIVAKAALPGIPEDNIDVTVDEGIVRIVGSVEKDEEKGKRRNFMTTLSSSYNYTFRLPPGIITDQEPISVLEDGILTMRFTKLKKAPPKKLKITKRSKEKSH